LNADSGERERSSVVEAPCVLSTRREGLGECQLRGYR
jgi:hypothetical protein